MAGSHFADLREDLARFIVKSMALSSLLIAPLLYWRTLSEGGQPIVAVYFIFPIFCNALWLLHQRLSSEVVVTLFALLNCMVFVTGILERGIYGPAFYFLSVAFLAWSCVLETRRLFIAAVFIVALGAAAQFAFFSGWFQIPADRVFILTNPVSWLAYSAVALYATMLIAYAVHRYMMALSELTGLLFSSQERLSYEVDRDPLTSLLNVRALRQRAEQLITQARRGSGAMAFLYIDLDGFKAINDRCGHDAGDNVLQHVAAALQTRLRASDAVGRIGGDEFGIAMADYGGDEQLDLIVRQLLHEIEQPVRVDDGHVSVTASIGIARFPDDGDDIAALQKAADGAMYRAKRAGRQRAQNAGDA